MPEKNIKKEDVRAMFNNIAPQYDFLNHFLSFGIDFYWRRIAIKHLKTYSACHTLDIATGTGDMAILAAKKNATKKITGIDISMSMLKIGKDKVRKNNLEDVITLDIGDSENIPFKENTFDAAMVAYGVRNFIDLQRGLSDIQRVLKPNAPLLILEFSIPENPIVRALYKFYSFRILPLIGRIISNNSKAYMYLPETVSKFPSGKNFDEIFKNCGFENTKIIPLTFGISTLYIGHSYK